MMRVVFFVAALLHVGCAGAATVAAQPDDGMALEARDVSLAAEAAVEALGREDECQSSIGGGSCALSAMQFRGSPSSTAGEDGAPEAMDEEGAPEAMDEDVARKLKEKVVDAAVGAADDLRSRLWKPRQAVPDGAFDWIRDIAAGPGGKYVLEAKTYLIDGQYQLPPNTEIHGAGSGGSLTIVKAVGPHFWHNCNEHTKNRKGFLLGDNTYVGKLHFVGMDGRRMCDNQLLCGGAPFETPGCKGTGKFEEAPESCGGDLGIGRGVQNATVEDVTIEPYTVQSIFYAAPTRRGVAVSRDITIRKVICNGTWADGLNIHGAHENVLVEDCEVRNTGDDTFAIWSVQPGADNVTFQRNIAVNPWFRPGCLTFCTAWNSNYCFALYGGKGSKILNSTCMGARYMVAYGNILHATYGGTFTEESSTLVQGLRGMAGDPCYFGVPFKGKVLGCTAERP